MMSNNKLKDYRDDEVVYYESMNTGRLMTDLIISSARKVDEQVAEEVLTKDWNNETSNQICSTNVQTNGC